MPEITQSNLVFCLGGKLDLSHWGTQWKDSDVNSWNEQEVWENCVMESAVICITVTKWRGIRWLGNVARKGRRELNAGIWYENLKGLHGSSSHWRVYIEMDRKEMFWGECGLDWSGSGQRPNEHWVAWNVGLFFGGGGLGEELLASQEGLHRALTGW